MPTLAGYDEFRLAQAGAQCIPLLELVAQTIRERGYARAHDGELGFRLRGIRGLGRRPPCAGAIQGSRCDCDAYMREAAVAALFHPGAQAYKPCARCYTCRSEKPMCEPHAATVRVYWPSSLFGERSGTGCRSRGFL